MSNLHTIEISTSYPYLSIAKKFGLDYGGVLMLAEVTQSNGMELADLFRDSDHSDMLGRAAEDLRPRELGPICDLINELYRFDEDWELTDISAFWEHMDAAANLVSFVKEYADSYGLEVKDAWRPNCKWGVAIDQFLSRNSGDQIPF